MELNWYSEDDLNNAIIFNDNSLISYKNNDSIKEKNENIVVNNIKVENCFDQNINITTGSELLNILHYLSSVSNHLRTLIRNKNIKQYNEEVVEIIQIINNTEYEKIINYLEWIKETLFKIKKYFAISNRKDNSYDPSNIKPFKTSSYKFCNFKESCSIHKNKNKTCDKNHFVFDMILNDINKLIESIKLINIDNLNWILNNKNIMITYSNEDNNYLIAKLNNNKINFIENENNFLIDKTLVFKSFDVSSYVLNKMYEEAFSFLNYNIQTNQILI
jgi:hypothetical protein